MASGSADGWSYFGLGHAFVANMTGNTVLLGVSLFQPHAALFGPLISLVCYCAGTAVATLISHRMQPGALWDKSISWNLFLEALLLIIAEITWVAIGYHPGPRTALALLGCVAFAIGLQSSAMLQLEIPGVVTTYITGTWTTLTHGLAQLGIDQPRVVREKTKFEERFALQATILGAYFLSAVLTGWAFRHVQALVGAVPSITVLVVAAYGALRD